MRQPRPWVTRACALSVCAGPATGKQRPRPGVALLAFTSPVPAEREREREESRDRGACLQAEPSVRRAAPCVWALGPVCPEPGAPRGLPAYLAIDPAGRRQRFVKVTSCSVLVQASA